MSRTKVSTLGSNAFTALLPGVRTSKKTDGQNFTGTAWRNSSGLSGVTLDGYSDIGVIDVDEWQVPYVYGDRVRVEVKDRALVVTANMTMEAAQADEPNRQLVHMEGAAAMSREGTITMPSQNWEKVTDQVYWAQVDQRWPYVPPSGYAFQYWIDSISGTPGWVFLTKASDDTTARTSRLQFLRIGGTAANPRRIGWRLFRT